VKNSIHEKLPFSDMELWTAELTEADAKRVVDVLCDDYDVFLTRTREGRGSSEEMYEVSLASLRSQKISLEKSLWELDIHFKEYQDFHKTMKKEAPEGFWKAAQYLLSLLRKEDYSDLFFSMNVRVLCAQEWVPKKKRMSDEQVTMIENRVEAMQSRDDYQSITQKGRETVHVDDCINIWMKEEIRCSYKDLLKARKVRMEILNWSKSRESMESVIEYNSSDEWVEQFEKRRNWAFEQWFSSENGVLHYNSLEKKNLTETYMFLVLSELVFSPWTSDETIEKISQWLSSDERSELLRQSEDILTAIKEQPDNPSKEISNILNYYVESMPNTGAAYVFEQEEFAWVVERFMKECRENKKSSFAWLEWDQKDIYNRLRYMESQVIWRIEDWYGLERVLQKQRDRERHSMNLTKEVLVERIELIIQYADDEDRSALIEDKEYLLW